MDRIRNGLTETGHEEARFPLLIPEDQLEKESQHVAGFESEVFWVTKGGTKKLEKELALRPTSETVVYPMAALWIRSHTDLPMKLFQVVNTFRYETKHTKPLIRDREIPFFKEAHCFHEDWEDAEKEMSLIKDLYSDVMNDIGVPVLVSKRPEWDKFPGAEYTVSFDTIMPDGKTLQIATSHNLGKTFSDVFDIEFENEDGEHDKPIITCHGISERIIAALISVHGDEKGLVLPPEFAPVQVAVVPVVFKGKEEKTMEKAREVANSLDCRTELDDRDVSPGEKYYYWEMKGVPIRIEIGPKEVKEDKALIVRRETREKETVPLKQLEERVNSVFREITENLQSKAQKKMQEMIVETESIEEVGSEQKVYKVKVCGNEECGKKLEKGTFEFRGTLLGEEPEGKCISCGKEAEHYGIVSKAY